jgi:hypothetical protein
LHVFLLSGSEGVNLVFCQEKIDYAKIYSICCMYHIVKVSVSNMYHLINVHPILHMVLLLINSSTIGLLLIFSTDLVYDVVN